MKIGVMVLEGPISTRRPIRPTISSRLRWRWDTRSAAFSLYTDGVNNANGFIKPPGERNIAERFSALAQQGIPWWPARPAPGFRGFRPDMVAPSVKLSGLGRYRTT